MLPAAMHPQALDIMDTLSRHCPDRKSGNSFLPGVYLLCLAEDTISDLAQNILITKDVYSILALYLLLTPLPEFAVDTALGRAVCVCPLFSTGVSQ